MEGGCRPPSKNWSVDVEMMQMMAEIVTTPALRRHRGGAGDDRRGAAGQHSRGGSYPRRYRSAFFEPLVSDWRNHAPGARRARPTAIDARPQILAGELGESRRRWMAACRRARCLCGGTQRRRWRALGRGPRPGSGAVRVRRRRRCGRSASTSVSWRPSDQAGYGRPRGTEHFAGHDRDVGLLEKGQGKGSPLDPVGRMSAKRNMPPSGACGARNPLRFSSIDTISRARLS